MSKKQCVDSLQLKHISAVKNIENHSKKPSKNIEVDLFEVDLEMHCCESLLIALQSTPITTYKSG
jgi:hypothetical protein